MFGIKRHIEEKTDDYQRRVAEIQRENQEKFIQRAEKGRKFKEEALAAAPEYLSKMEAKLAERLEAHKFSVVRSGDFLTVRLADIGGERGHAVNLSSVRQITFEAGLPISADKGQIEWDEYGWSWSRGLLSVGYSGRWRERERGFPREDVDAAINFVGVDLQLKIPQPKGQEVYDAILSAVSA